MDGPQLNTRRVSARCVAAAGIAAVVVTISASLGLVLSVQSPRVDRALAVFPFWWRADRVFAAAASAGDVVATGPLWSALIVRGSPKTLARGLRSAGALMIIDARGFGGCFS